VVREVFAIKGPDVIEPLAQDASQIPKAVRDPTTSVNSSVCTRRGTATTSTRPAHEAAT
jgi:hypothetical protein